MKIEEWSGFLSRLDTEMKRFLKNVFEDLHAMPEVGWQEYKTTAYLTDLLKKQGFHVTTFEGSTGLYVELGEGKEIVGLRTDIDGLWQQVNGEFKGVHSCGHDAHMTMAVGVLFLLQKALKPNDGRVRVLFQPAEEKGNGALSFVERGLVDDLSFLFGMHIRPIQEMIENTYSPVLYHGAARLIEGTIFGQECHGARPHLGKNTIEIGASLVAALSHIHIDPMIPSSVKLTSFQAGNVQNANTIPGIAHFTIDARSQTNEGMEQLMHQLQLAILGVEQAHRAQIEFETKATIVAAQVDDTAKQLMKQSIIEVCGVRGLAEDVVTPGGEDFHYYTLKRPSVKATMLGVGCGATPGLHDPNMTFQFDGLYPAIEIMTQTIVNALRFTAQRNKSTDAIVY